MGRSSDEATFWDRDKGRGVYGARKMVAQLLRDGVTGPPTGDRVARCSVERLMRSLGLRGVRRGRAVVTTRPDQQSERAPDRSLWLLLIADLGYTFTFGVHDPTIFTRSLVADIALPVLLLIHIPVFFTRHAAAR